MSHLQANDEPPRITRPQLLLRPSCLLCLEAEHVLAQAGIDDFERIDIERVPGFEERYGTRIPVIRNPVGGGEIDWPFDSMQIVASLAETDKPAQSNSSNS